MRLKARITMRLKADSLTQVLKDVACPECSSGKVELVFELTARYTLELDTPHGERTGTASKLYPKNGNEIGKLKGWLCLDCNASAYSDQLGWTGSDSELARLQAKELPGLTFPGAYPIVYYDHHNAELCAKCATKAQTDDDPDFRPDLKRTRVHYEGPPVWCSECDQAIESAYGDPDEDDNPA